MEEKLLMNYSNMLISYFSKIVFTFCLSILLANCSYKGHQTYNISSFGDTLSRTEHLNDGIKKVVTTQQVYIL